jgi:hypothetical protein
MHAGGLRQQWGALASPSPAAAVASPTPGTGARPWLAGRMAPPRVTLADALSRINLSGHSGLIQVRTKLVLTPQGPHCQAPHTAPVTPQVWFPDAGGTRLTLQPPHAYVPSHGGIPKSAALEQWRAACAAQPLCLRSSDSMPCRAYNSKAPDWSPSLSRFPDEDCRMGNFMSATFMAVGAQQHTISGCLAVPVFLTTPLDEDDGGNPSIGSSSGAGNAVAAVIEIIFSRWELCGVADALRAVAVAMQTAQLHVPLAPVLTLSPLTVPRCQTPALVRLTAVMHTLAGDHQLSMAQIWVPATAEGHNQPVNTTSRGESQTLHTRGLPHIIRLPSAWGYRACCASSALRCGTLGTGAAVSATQGDSPRCDASQMPQGTPGAAFSAHGAVWVAHPMALRHACNPLRAVASLCGVPLGSVSVMVIAPSNAQDAAPLPFMLEMLLPPGAPHTQLRAMATLLPALAAASGKVQLTALLPARKPLAATLQALAARAEAASCALPGTAAAPVAWVTGSRSASARAPDAFFSPPMSRSTASGVLTGVYESVMPPAWAPPSRAEPTRAVGAVAPQQMAMTAPPHPATAAVPVAPVAGAPISLAQIQAQFSNPLRRAAAALKVCPTTLKAACRRHGIQKWPYRTLAKLQNNADRLRGAIENVGGTAMEAAVNLRAMSLPATSPALKLSTKGAAAAAARRKPRKQAAKREDTASDSTSVDDEGEMAGADGDQDDSAMTDERKRMALPPRKRSAAPPVAQADDTATCRLLTEADGAQAAAAPRCRRRVDRVRDSDGCFIAAVPIPVVAASMMAAATPMAWSGATPWPGAMLPLHPVAMGGLSTMGASPTLSGMGPAWTPHSTGLRGRLPVAGVRGGDTNVSALGGTPRLLWQE